MLEAEQVPEEVWKTLRREIEGPGLRYWNEVFAAALNAWPGMGTVATEDHAGVWRQIILPLPQEIGNE